jgi:hypothetical protein
MGAPKEILDLVKRFDQNSEAYLSGQYNETQLRREFLDPFFKALGWDIDNVAGYAEAYKDVIHEDAIRIGSYLKAPDYCFRIGGTRKFFVEAKKPSVSIADETPSSFAAMPGARNCRSAFSATSRNSPFTTAGSSPINPIPRPSPGFSTARIATSPRNGTGSPRSSRAMPS